MVQCLGRLRGMVERATNIHFIIFMVAKTNSDILINDLKKASRVRWPP